MLLCEDESVIGTIFYLMEFVDGRIFWDPSLPEIDTEQRRAVYKETVRVMTALQMLVAQVITLNAKLIAG